MTDLSKLISLKQAAEIVGCNTGKLRREAKAGRVPGAMLVLGHWGFDSEALAGYEAPEKGSFGGGSKRADGRLAFKIYLTDEEAAALQEGGFEIVDPRVARAARKAKAAEAAKAAAAAEEVEPSTEVAPPMPTAVIPGPPVPPAAAASDDPFAAFGN